MIMADKQKKKRKITGYTIFRWIFLWPVRLVLRIHVRGKENIPDGDGYMICSNHISCADPIMICAAFPKKVCYMGKKEVFKVPILGLLIRALGAFPVDRSGGNAGTIKNAIAKLKRGDCLGLFPQGTRCKGKEIGETPLKMGAAMIAVKANAAIVPVKIVMKDHRYRFLRKATVVIGKPITAEEMAYDKENPGEYARITELIGKRIGEITL